MVFAACLMDIAILGPVLLFLALYIIISITTLIVFILVVKYNKRVTLTSEGFVAAQMGPRDPVQLPYSDIAYIAWSPNWPNMLQIHMRTRWPRTIEMPLKDLNIVVWILWSKGLEFRRAVLY
jgi:hypothetical protein